MLDIQFIRDNRESVSVKSQQKGYPVDINRLLELDSERRDLLRQVEQLRQKRNDISGQMKGGLDSERGQELVEQGKQLKIELAEREKYLGETEAAYTELLKQVPNMPHDDVPVGASEDENVVAKTWGQQPAFDFEPKNHWQLAETRGLIDKDRAAKVAGARFAYIKGDLVLLQFAIIQWVLAALGSETTIAEIIKEQGLNISTKPFTPVLPPAMIKTDVFDAMDRLEPRDERYQVGDEKDGLWLQGSAEHTLGSMYKDEVIAEADLPIRYIGYSSSFRREAGSYGKDMEGIIRLHQFDKLEMEVFSTPETGHDEHKLLAAVQEHLVQQLNVPYQVLQKCTFDIGKPNARGVDINVWLPGQGKYRETHTADYMTDYQARRLKTRTKRQSGAIDFVHTNDATAFALGRIMVAIMENYQQQDGTVVVPEVLRPYMGGKEII